MPFAASSSFSPPQSIGIMQSLQVSAPWYGLMKAGKKTIEGRLNKGKFAEIRIGTVLHITPSSSNTNAGGFVAVVTQINKYASFEQYLSQEGLLNCLPGIATIREGVAVYRKFYTAEMERELGVLAIHFVRA